MAMAHGFDRYARSIGTWLHWEAYRLCRDWHEAEDLTQVTLLKVYRRWENLGGRDLLGRYTHRTLLRTYLNERRHPRWSREVLQADPPELSVAGPEHSDGKVWAAVGHLAARQRAVVVLRFWDDLTVEQTAMALGCTQGAITSQTHRALAHLRLALADTRWGHERQDAIYSRVPQP
jgi:RNA polymerase sigma factor (sigma-70 family)